MTALLARLHKLKRTVATAMTWLQVAFRWAA